MSRPLAVREGTALEMPEGTPNGNSAEGGESGAAQLAAEHTDGMQQNSVAQQWVAPAAAAQQSTEK